MTEPPPLEERDGGVVLAVRATPGAARDRVVGWHGGALKVAVTAAPERGKANRRILAVIAAALGVPPATMRLLSGAASRDKRVFVARIDAARVRAALVDPTDS